MKEISVKKTVFYAQGAMGSGTFAPLCKLELLTNKQNEYEDKVFLFSGNAANEWAQWGQAPLRPFRRRNGVRHLCARKLLSELY